MKEKSKSLIIGAAILLTFFSCFLSISSSQQASKIREGLDQERYNRMVVEEQLEKAKVTIVSLQSQLEGANTKIKGIQALVEEGQNATSDLQAQLQSVSQLKSSLEKKLEEIQQKSMAAAAAPVVSAPAPAAGAQ